MPADKLRDDLPSYQESALGRWLTQVLMTRAALRREAYGATPRQGLRVRAKQPRRGTQPTCEPMPPTSATTAEHEAQQPAAIQGSTANPETPKVTEAQLLGRDHGERIKAKVTEPRRTRRPHRDQ